LSDPRTVALLRSDPALGDALDRRDFETAQDEVLATSALLQPSPEPALWGPEQPRAEIGLLVVDGLLLRDLVIRDRRRSELLGPGDVVRPWDTETAAHLPGQATVAWRVLATTRVGFLDRRFIDSARAWPEILGAVAIRAVRRAQSLAAVLTLTSFERTEDQVALVFWHLADRWGEITPQGVRLDLPLTPDLLAELVGAETTAVANALNGLAESNSVVRDDQGSWLLRTLPEGVWGSRTEVAPFSE
jgi:hypothetical protein